MPMSDRDTKVIGYFAYASPMQVVCTGKACVIAGSEQSMKDYLQEIDPEGAKRRTIRKTRFGEILQGMRLGGAYAFDEESYARFYPLARTEGLNVAEADFKAAHQSGDRFFTVQLIGL